MSSSTAQKVVGEMSQNLGLGIRNEFPIFKNGGVAYLDSAASSLKPRCVTERISHYLAFEHANIHRGAYKLSAEATENYEATRAKVAKFIGASDDRSIIFTKNSTEAINLVAFSYGEKLQRGDKILLTVLEHHSNIVPWQLLAERRGVKLEFAEINPDASLNLADFKEKLLAHRPKLVSFTAISNAFGSVLPVAELLEAAKKVGAKVLLDASQLVMHRALRVEEFGADFVAFTGHKMYGPTGVGVLYGKPDLLNDMVPYQGGGDMIERVTVEGSTWAEIPRRFEAGTPPIAEVIALGTAIDFINRIGLGQISQHESSMLHYGFEKLKAEPGVTVYGPINSGGEQSSILSFNVEGVHPHDLSTIVDSVGVQIRAGHHCAMPAMKALGLPWTARASVGIYTAESDFDALIEGIRKAKRMMNR